MCVIIALSAHDDALSSSLGIPLFFGKNLIGIMATFGKDEAFQPTRKSALGRWPGHDPNTCRLQRPGDTAHAAARQSKRNTIYLGNSFSSHLYDPVAVSCTRVEVLSLQGISLAGKVALTQ